MSKNKFFSKVLGLFIPFLFFPSIIPTIKTSPSFYSLENFSSFRQLDDSPLKTLSITDASGTTKVKISFYGVATDFKFDSDYSSVQIDEQTTTSLPTTDAIQKTDENKKVRIKILGDQSKSYKFFSCCPAESGISEYIISADTSKTFANCREISNFGFGGISTDNVNSKTNEIGSNSLSYNMKLLLNSGLNSVKFNLGNTEKSSMVGLTKTGAGSVLSTRYAFKGSKEVTLLNPETFYSTGLTQEDIGPKLGLTSCTAQSKDLDAGAYRQENGANSLCKDVDEGKVILTHISMGQACAEATVFGYDINREMEVKKDEKKKLPAWAIAVISIGSAAVVGTGAFFVVWSGILKKPLPCECCKKGPGAGEGDIKTADESNKVAQSGDEENKKKKRSIHNEAANDKGDLNNIEVISIEKS